MKTWEDELAALVKSKKVVNIENIPDRYEIRPGLTGPNLVCTTCAREISTNVSTRLVDLVEEAAKHDLDNH